MVTCSGRQAGRTEVDRVGATGIGWPVGRPASNTTTIQLVRWSTGALSAMNVKSPKSPVCKEPPPTATRPADMLCLGRPPPSRIGIGSGLVLHLPEEPDGGAVRQVARSARSAPSAVLARAASFARSAPRRSAPAPGALDPRSTERVSRDARSVIALLRDLRSRDRPVALRADHGPAGELVLRHGAIAQLLRADAGVEERADRVRGLLKEMNSATRAIAAAGEGRRRLTSTPRSGSPFKPSARRTYNKNAREHHTPRARSSNPARATNSAVSLPAAHPFCAPGLCNSCQVL